MTLASVNPPSGDPSAAAPARPWSVALSGGGHRAALFAAGALLYLADEGELEKVGSIASVSGGSITNGVLACSEKDVSTLNANSLRDVFEDLIERCAVTGTVQYAREAKLVLAGIGLSVLGAVLGIVWCVRGHWGGRGFGAIVLFASLLLLIALYESISWVADRVFNRLFFKSARLNEVSSSITHVFCTSELQSKLHLYLSQHFTYNRSFTHRPVRTGPIRMSTAVQASACLPPVFPTRRFRARLAGLPSTFARRVWLSDGGVYDNMGDEWARGYWEHARGGAPAFEMGPVPEKLLIVNASAPGRGKKAAFLNRIPLIGDLYAIKAEIDVMYKETTATRRADMWWQFDLVRQLGAYGNPLDHGQLGGSLVHIATPATWPAKTIHRPAGVTEQNWAVAVGALARLDAATRSAVEVACASASSVGTTLRRVGREPAADLLWHGYLLTMVNFVVFEGRQWRWKERSAFLDLVDSYRPLDGTAANPAAMWGE